MTESAFQQLLQRYLAGQCTPAEARVVELLYEAMGQPGAAPIAPPEQEKLLGAMWQRLEAQTHLPNPQGKERPRPVALWQAAPVRWAAAALFALVMGGGLFWAARQPAAGPGAVAQGPASAVPAWTQHINTTQQVQVFALPDHSLVNLSPASSLRYATGLAGSRRMVYLSGEAFFKVSKNPARPFLVLTNQVVTTVLGTSFRVKAYAGSANATVLVREGRVAVQARAGAHLEATPNRPAAAGVLLLPNQQVVYSGPAQSLRKQLVAQPVELVPQPFVFDARPVAEVLRALEKAYGVDIAYEPEVLESCTVTLDLTNKSLADKLNVLCQALGATYEESNARIFFHSKGCKK